MKMLKEPLRNWKVNKGSFEVHDTVKDTEEECIAFVLSNRPFQFLCKAPE